MNNTITHATEELKLPEVAVVILNWNGVHFLEQFLPSVLSSTYRNKRIIVADNQSSDHSVAFVKEHFPQVEIIVNKQNEGFAKGYNCALKQVQSDYYVLLNSDVEVTEDWIEPIISLMEENRKIAACQPKILNQKDKEYFEYAGAAGGWIDNWGYPFAKGRIFDHIEKDNGQYNSISPCFWASGAAMFVRADLYHEAGGLDEFFFAHQEEIDLCWRLQLMGYEIYYNPSSKIYHVGGGTLPAGNKRKTYLNFRNNLIMLYKNLPAYKKWYVIPIRMELDYIAALKGLFSGDLNFFTMIFKAHFHFLGWIFAHQKESIFPIRKRNKLAGIYNGSIIWEYYIKKKKTFLQIIGNK